MLFVFLNAQSALGSMLRMPVLIHHYIEHAEINAETTLLSFLQSHYTENINHHDDVHHDHEKLPFKNHDSGIHQVMVLSIENPVSPVPDMPGSEQKGNKLPDCQSYFYSFTSRIWQPPRLV